MYVTSRSSNYRIHSEHETDCLCACVIESEGERGKSGKDRDRLREGRRVGSSSGALQRSLSLSGFCVQTIACLFLNNWPTRVG